MTYSVMRKAQSRKAVTKPVGFMQEAHRGSGGHESTIHKVERKSQPKPSNESYEKVPLAR